MNAEIFLRKGERSVPGRYAQTKVKRNIEKKENRNTKT